MGKLYVVATPIGNKEDITLRALNILKECDVIACEDTRVTGRLLSLYEIKAKRLLSCRSANEKKSSIGLIKLLERGEDVAYVSDAGTPGVSDPGKILVSSVREAGIEVVPIPGVSAVTTIFSVAGIAGKGYFFEGFLPQKGKKREDRLSALLDRGDTFILYESPFRLIKLLESLKKYAPERKVFVGREITKKFEEYIVDLPEKVLAMFQERGTIKGEVSLVIEGKKQKRQ